MRLEPKFKSTLKMKTTVLIIVAFLTIQLAYTQVYTTTAIKLSERVDAYPFGEPKTIQVAVWLNLDQLQLKLSSVPNYNFTLKKESQRPTNNGTQIRLSSKGPDQKKCYIIAYIEDNKLQTLEIRHTKITYKLFMEQL